ncbi:BTAD domain-containing putative transcriptional regulator [Streptomyces sp. NPDC048473]|uniref:BTAD domain-containing putative transcriptional regulator n=1 Tax=unclassified Streptomyces TaxID=2593676 RepID=UPI00371D0718
MTGGPEPRVPEAWLTTLSLAQRAQSGDTAARDQVKDAVQQLSRDPELLSIGDLGQAVTGLTGLLDDLEEPEVSQALLRQVVSRLTAKGTDVRSRQRSLNRIAVALANRGQLTAAEQVLSAAIKTPWRRSDSDYTALAITSANLAAVELGLNDVDAAGRSADRAAQFIRMAPASTQSDGRPVAQLELRLRVASLKATTARARNKHAAVEARLDEIAEIARSLVGLLGGEHPKSLSALVTLALAECESATASGDRDRSERAVDVLLIAAQKAAASAGGRHPLTVTALSSLAAAEGLVALDSGDSQRLSRAEALTNTAQERSRAAAENRGLRRPTAPREAQLPQPQPDEAAPREAQLPQPQPDEAAPREAQVPQPQPDEAAPREAQVPQPQPDEAAPREAQVPQPQPDEAVDVSTLTFSVLGPVGVWRDGLTVTIGSLRERLLLATLLLHEGRVVPTDVLIRAVWGDSPLALSTALLHVHVARLRRRLGPDVLVRKPPGYLLRLAPGSLDLHRARELAEQAGESRAAGRAEEARAFLNQALALWTGDPLEALPVPDAEEEREQLREWRLELLATRLELDLELGEPEKAIAELTELTAEDPQRRRWRKLLMLALHRSEQQADAVDQYSAARRLLADALGDSPDASLRDLERRMREDRP